jgi:hypothetical protein
MDPRKLGEDEGSDGHSVPPDTDTQSICSVSSVFPKLASSVQQLFAVRTRVTDLNRDQLRLKGDVLDELQRTGKGGVVYRGCSVRVVQRARRGKPTGNRDRVCTRDEVEHIVRTVLHQNLPDPQLDPETEQRIVARISELQFGHHPEVGTPPPPPPGGEDDPPPETKAHLVISKRSARADALNT